MPESLANGIAFFVAIGIPTIIVASIFLVRRILSFRERKLELEAEIEIARAQQRGGESLEQRLRVVERIVTDQGHGLSEEIERLRIAGK